MQLPPHRTYTQGGPTPIHLIAPAVLCASVLIGVLLHAPSLQDLVGWAGKQLSRLTMR